MTIMFSHAATYDRWENVVAQAVAPPDSAWLGQGNTYGNAYEFSHVGQGTINLLISPSGHPPAAPPPAYSPSTSDYPPSPTFRLELPPPSPPAGPSSSPFVLIRFDHPVAPPTRHRHNPATHASPSPFSRPVCNTCHINSVSVREGITNFCERCFQDALKRRGRKESSRANRLTCRSCRVNFVNVREGDVSYCERCWQEALRK